jgi:hypothetical protein
MKKIYLLIVFFGFFAASLSAQTDKKTIEVYGFAMTDAGYQFKEINPDWYDALRFSKLPSYDKQYAPDGKVFFSARQSRLGVKSSMPTKFGEFTTKFEFDMFGVGGDAGQTTIRLRHAYGQLGRIGAGQTNSAFMDGDIFPNSLEYWGPGAMLFFRNVQIRYMPLMDKKNDLTIALENPGASGDGGVYADRIELTTVKPLFNVPDLTAHYRYTDKWGYVQIGGIVGSIKYRNIADTAQFNLNGSVVRWGAALSTNINVGKKAIVRLMGVYGEGCENYFNDAPTDVGLQSNGNNEVTPVVGKALPVYGVTAFVDVNWSKLFSSSIGFSYEHTKNSDLQSPSAFKDGQYGLVNLLYYPIDNVMVGAELLFARRDNFSDGFHSTNPQFRLGFKYNFSRVFTL